MRVSPCVHPHSIRNPYTGDVVTVRCGKCDACRNTRAALWVQKLDQEMLCHRYTLFVTLQYNDLDIPQVVRLRKEDTPFISGKYSWSYIDCDTGQIISFDDPSVTRHSKADKEFIFDTKVLNVLSRRDAQLFIKKFRYYAKTITNDYGNVRYFLTGEYGGKTFRPHFHALLFFDDERIIANIDELLLKSWRHGNIYDPHLVSGSASQYVASYVNSLAKLPSIFEHASIRQFHLFSKHPAIGTLQVLQSDIEKTFFEESITQRLYSVSKNRFVDVPTWRSIQDRCFPRLPRFDSLSHSDRVLLYSFGKRFSESPAKVCAEWLARYFVRNYDRNKRGDLNNFFFQSAVASYFYDISHIPFFDKLSRVSSTRFSINPLLHFVYIVRRVCSNAVAFGISIDDYVTKIESFYEKIKKSNLKDYYKFQDEYFKLHPEESHALYFDYAFVERVNNKPLSVLSKTDQWLCRTYMLVDDLDDIVHIDLSDCFDYRDMKSLHEVISHKNTKTKLMNDYVYSRSNEFQNIINYYKNLSDIT